MLRSLSALPDELIQKDSHLCLSQALLLFLTGQLPEALMHLQEAKHTASHIGADSAPMFLNQVATLQAYVLFFQGDLASSVALAEQASDQLSEGPLV